MNSSTPPRSTCGYKDNTIPFSKVGRGIVILHLNTRGRISKPHPRAPGQVRGIENLPLGNSEV